MLRLKPKVRKQEILTAALNVARKHGFDKMTRSMIADKAGCSHGLVTLRFKTMQNLQSEVMREAIKNEFLDIIATGIVIGNSVALRAPLELRNRAVTQLAK